MKCFKPLLCILDFANTHIVKYKITRQDGILISCRLAALYTEVKDFTSILESLISESVKPPTPMTGLSSTNCRVLLRGDDVCPENEGHLGEWLSTLEFIHSKTSEAVREFQALQKEHPNCLEYSWLEGGAKSALEKCKHYYDLVDSSATYYATEALQSAHKWGWLHEQ
jgi:hypothetical protein